MLARTHDSPAIADVQRTLGFQDLDAEVGVV
jgi:hypothetical protein